MKLKVVRNNVFETNSSSCHSLSITSDNNLSDIPTPSQNGNIDIWSQTFGWEVDSYNDFGTKASYIAIYCRDWSGNKSEEHFKIFEDCIKEVTQCKNVTYGDGMLEYETKTYTNSNNEEVIYKDYGWDASIDHQSVESEDLHHLFENTDELKRFLFSRNSILETDNDNH